MSVNLSVVHRLIASWTVVASCR